MVAVLEVTLARIVPAMFYSPMSDYTDHIAEWRSRPTEPGPYAEVVVVLPYEDVQAMMRLIGNLGQQHIPPRDKEHLAAIEAELAAVKAMVDNPRPPGMRVIET